MPGFPSPVLRALAGLPEGSGRTVAIAGPPFSGKSETLEGIRQALIAQGVRILLLRGTYRDRARPYAALEGLEPTGPGLVPPPTGIPTAALGLAAEEDDPDVPAPISPVAFATDEVPRSRRARGDRAPLAFLGGPMRKRGAARVDPAEFYRELCDGFSGADRAGVAFLVEDATLVDSESREFLLYQSERARWRPLLVVLALDTSLPAFAAWEERLLGRGDVDWVRIPRARYDPREGHRMKETFDAVPDATRRVLVYTALLGGNVTEVSLGRATRMNWRALAEALAPAVEANLVKVAEGRVTIPHEAWTALLPDLIPESVRREMHREIADALAALNPEPDLKRRLELAEHYFAWSPGVMALRYLLETAELSERLFAYDTAEELLAKAITCLPALPAPERSEAEIELRLFHARTLAFSGRISEAETEMLEGINGGLLAHLPPDRIEELVEALLPALRAVGPRPSLLGALEELCDRCHTADALSAEVLFESVVAELEFERGRLAEARAEADRAARRARQLEAGPVQGVALLAVGLALSEGSGESRTLAPKFLTAARSMLAASRRYGLEAHAEEIHLRLLELRRDPAEAARAHARAIPVVRRLGLLSIELAHQLDLATIDLDQTPGPRTTLALKRAREIVEQLHLLPPSPVLLRHWLLEGRLAATEGRLDDARDRWSAIDERPTPTSLPRVRAEAVVRLALLEYADERPDAARRWVARFAAPEAFEPFDPDLPRDPAELARRAPESHHGGGALTLATGAPAPTSAAAGRRRLPRVEDAEPAYEPRGMR